MVSAAASFLLSLILAADARAQSVAAAPARFELGASIGVDGGVNLGGRDATLTANGIGRTADSFVLFRTNTEMRRARAFGGRLALALGRILSIEGAASLHQPAVVTTVQSDVERSDATFTVDERLSRYAFEGSALLHLTALSFADGRGLPFVSAGAAYLRDLHDGNVLIQAGRAIHAGAGIKYYYLARRDRFLKAAGLRAEGRLEVVSRGFNPGDKSRRHGSGAAGLFVGF